MLTINMILQSSALVNIFFYRQIKNVGTDRNPPAEKYEIVKKSKDAGKIPEDAGKNREKEKIWQRIALFGNGVIM